MMQLSFKKSLYKCRFGLFTSLLECSVEKGHKEYLNSFFFYLRKVSKKCLVDLRNPLSPSMLEALQFRAQGVDRNKEKKTHLICF